MKEINEDNLEQIVEVAELKAKIMTPDNSAPLMTHDIEGKLCTGLSDCPVYQLDFEGHDKPIPPK